MEGRPRQSEASKLIRKWKTALDNYDGSGEALLLTEYRVDRHAPHEPETEVTGLIIWDTGGRAHHFRLFDTGKAVFIEAPNDPDANITIDPYGGQVDDTVYVTGGVPTAVSERIAAMDLSPLWSEACEDGNHDFKRFNQEDQKDGPVVCGMCNIPRSTLSWIGHAVPAGDP